MRRMQHVCSKPLPRHDSTLSLSLWRPSLFLLLTLLHAPMSFNLVVVITGPLPRRDKCWKIINGFAASRARFQLGRAHTDSVRFHYLSSSPLLLLLIFNTFQQVAYLVLALANNKVRPTAEQLRTLCCDVSQLFCTEGVWSFCSLDLSPRVKTHDSEMCLLINRLCTLGFTHTSKRHKRLINTLYWNISPTDMD